MKQIRFQYKKFWEPGAFQEAHIGFDKTFRNLYFSISQPWELKTNYKDTARIKSSSIS